MTSKLLGSGLCQNPREARRVAPMCAHQDDVQHICDRETRVFGEWQRSVEALSASAKMLIAWISAIAALPSSEPM